MMKCSVMSSPGMTGAVVVSQPVDPPIGSMPPVPKMPPVVMSSKPVPMMSLIGLVQVIVCAEEPFWHTVNRPLLMVIGFLFMSNEMLVAVGVDTDDSIITRNASLNMVQT